MRGISGQGGLIRLSSMSLRNVVTRAPKKPDAPLILGIALFALVATGSVIESIGFAVAVGVHVWSGRRIVRKLAVELRDPFFVLGAGILVSTLLFTAVAQALRSLEAGSTLALALLLIIGLLCRRREDDETIPIDWQLCLLFVAVLCRGLQGAYWASALACLIVTYLLGRTWLERKFAGSRRTITSIFFLVGTTLVVLVKNAQSWWWFPTSNDASYFEAISNIVTQFGPSEHPGVAGGSLIGYHWFSYGWSGAISDAVNLPPWHGLAILTPFVTLIVGASLIVAFFVEFGKTPSKVLAIVISIITLVSSATFTVSAWFGNYWLLALMLAVTMCLRRLGQRIPSVLLALLAAGTIFAKSTNIVVVLLLLGFGGVALFAVRRIRSAIQLGVPIVGVCILAYLYFSSGIGPQFVERSSLLCSAADLASCAAEGFSSNKRFVALAAILIVVGFGVGRVLKNAVLSLIAVSLGFGQLVVVIIFRPSDVPTYVTNSIFFVSTVIVGLIYFAYVSHDRSGSFQRSIAGSAGVLFVIGLLTSTWAFVRRTTELDDKFPGLLDRWDRVYSATGIWALTLVGGLVVVVYVVVFRRRDYLRLCVILVASILSFGCGQTVANNGLLYLTGSENFVAADGNSSAMATDDLIQVAEVVRTLTPASYILATNNFCCSGTSWLQEQLTSSGDWDPEKVGRLGESRYGGGNYLVQAFTQRRTLASGLRHLTTTIRSSTTVIAKVEASLRFANAPTDDGMNELCEMGAQGAVINLALTPFDDWSGPGSVKVHVGDFVFVDFPSCQR